MGAHLWEDAVVAYEQTYNVNERAEVAWARAVADDYPPGGDIDCDPLTLGPDRHLVMGSDFFCATVVSAPELHRVEIALERAAKRFATVDENGEELPEDEIDDQVFMVDEVGYPTRVQEGWKITVDFRGAAWPRMNVAMLQILVEELRRAGAVPARLRPVSVRGEKPR